MTWAIKAVHNVSRPDQEPEEGDTVEIECVGGYVMQVDPKTRRTTDQHQRFVLRGGGSLEIAR